MKYSIKLKQHNLPFASVPTLVELEGEKIVCNDVTLPAYIDRSCGINPHNVRAFVIGHEFGAICMIFGSNVQDALDEAVDANMLDCMLNDEQDHENDSLTSLGNASELFDLTYAWVGEVEFEAARDIQLIVALVRASENGSDTLE